MVGTHRDICRVQRPKTKHLQHECSGDDWSSLRFPVRHLLVVSGIPLQIEVKKVATYKMVSRIYSMLAYYYYIDCHVQLTRSS
jgi:hypothetical protein